MASAPYSFERFDARDRWQDGRCKPFDQPGRVGKILPTGAWRGLVGQQKLKRQRRKGTGWNENEFLAFNVLCDRIDTRLIKPQRTVQIERQLITGRWRAIKAQLFGASVR